ncbi:DNA-binding CsgD family transcriptional regulator [Streptacidiphilus sp. MAP12-33]
MSDSAFLSDSALNEPHTIACAEAPPPNMPPSGLPAPPLPRAVRPTPRPLIADLGRVTSVRLAYEPRRLRITVENEGPRLVAQHAPPGDERGHGLRGMRERMQIVGGTLDAGPRAEGGFRVSAERERQIVRLVATGLSNDDIADDLQVSPHTVKTHTKRAMAKLHAHDRAQLVVIAYEKGLVQPSHSAGPEAGSVTWDGRGSPR